MINLLHGDGQYGRLSRTFSIRDCTEDCHIGWIMEHVKMSPFTGELFLKDGEEVTTTLTPDGGITIDINNIKIWKYNLNN